MSLIVLALLQCPRPNPTSSNTETQTKLNLAVGLTIKTHNWPATSPLSQEQELSTYNTLFCHNVY